DGKKLDKIEAVSTLKYVAPKKAAGPFGITKGDMKFDKSKATYYFDAEAGRLVQLENRVSGKGKLTMSVMGQELEVEMEVDQSAKGRVLDKKPELRAEPKPEKKPAKK